MIVRELVTRLGFNVERSKITEFDRSIGTMRNTLSQVTHNMNQVANSFMHLGTRLSLFLSTPLLAANVAAIKVAAKMEQLDIAFEVMLGSAEKANALIQEMFEFAAKTPFEIRNIGPTVKQLLAMGIESDNVIDTLRMLGDVSAGLDVPISRLALNLGQVKAQGKLTGRELRDFAVAGVPLLDELSRVTGRSKREIQDMVSAGEVDFDLVIEAFRNMTAEGGKFFKLMERQSKTLGGLFSNLLDNLFLIAGDIGEVIVEVFDLKNAIQELNNFLGRLRDGFLGLSSTTQRWILAITLFLTLIGPILLGLGIVIKTFLFLKSTLIVLSTAMKILTVSTLQFKLTLLILPALILVVVSALGLLIDDIIGWVNGQDSLIGDVLGPWEKWRDTMLEFFGMVKRGFRDLITGDIDKLIEKGKLLAKTFGFLLEDFGVNKESLKQATDFLKGLEQTNPEMIARITQRPGEDSINNMASDRSQLGAGTNTPSSRVQEVTINSNVTVNPEQGTPESLLGNQIADTVRDTLQREIRKTVINNQD